MVWAGAGTLWPLKGVMPDALHRYFGVREVRHVRGTQALAVTEEVLS
jgi:Icc protein